MVTPKVDWRELTLSSRSVQCLCVPNRAGYPSRHSISAQDHSLTHSCLHSLSLLLFWEGEGGAEGMNANGRRTGEPGQTPGPVGSRARQSASPFPLCFAQKQAAGIVSDSSALRDGSRLDSNRGQYGEKRRRKERRRRKKKKKKEEGRRRRGSGEERREAKGRRRRKDGCGCRP